MVATLKTATDTTVATSTDTAVASDASMAFRAPTMDLKRAVTLLARIADRRSSIAALQNIALRVTPGKGVELVATDLNVTATIRLPLQTTSERAGGFCVNAKALADIVKRLPPDECEISRKGPLALAVTCGSLSSLLHGTPDRDFPKVPDDQADEIAWHPADADALAGMLEATEHARCKDETRFHLAGTLYENPDGESATCVATDGHRLVRAKRTMSGAPTTGVILPAKAGTEIRKLLDEGKRKGPCQMAIWRGMMYVRYGVVTIAAKLINAQFPPYEQVIPKDYSTLAKLATVLRKPMIAALKRAADMCTQTRGVKLTFADGKVKLTSDNPDTGESSESLEATSLWCESGQTFAVGANARYLLDALGEIEGDHVTFAMGGELDPILVRSTEHAVSFPVATAPLVFVIMPMRI